jgi:hypothetical protein
MVAASFTAYAYWPGLMTWDSVRQYDEALSGVIDNWHPPVMQWLWQWLIRIHPGPVPMLMAQLALYWGGLATLAGAMWRKRQRGLAWALLACGLLPLGLALTGAILKDSLMTGSLLAATATLAVRGHRGGLAPTLLGTTFLLFAATLRFNAFAACLPLLVAFLPRSYRATWPRMFLSGLLATAALLAVMPIANRLIGARSSGVELSLVIFDLGGITDHSGTSAFPPQLEVRDAVRVNHFCYHPIKWDSYSDWTDPECPLGYTAWNEKVIPQGVSPYRYWVDAIVRHPLAYAEHRLTHFAINTRLVPLPNIVERPIPIAPAPNPWGFHITPNRALWTIDGLALLAAHTPLGWPIVWLGLALGVVIAGWHLPCARLSVPLALSSLFYGGSYLVMSVAAELRYHLWTELAALIAIVLVASERHALSGRRLIWASIPTALITLTAIATRL